MSKVQYAVVCVLLVAIATVGAAPLVLSKPETAKPSRPNFEYKILSVPDLKFDEEMKKLGEAGWDVVFARRASGEDRSMSYEMIFKRLM